MDIRKKEDEICDMIRSRLEKKHIMKFPGSKTPVLLISEQYPGLWLEHVYDSIIYATLDTSKLYLAESAIDLFISARKEDGQLPYKVVSDGSRGYSQIQECVSFARLSLIVYEMNQNSEFLRRAYDAGKDWACWLRAHRMTMGKGLIELFVGHDTGHDNSKRLSGLSCPLHYIVDGVHQNAKILPPNETVAPIIAVDMNANYFATLTALSKMAEILGLQEEAKTWANEARAVKKALFSICFDKDEAFFFDVDRNENKRRYLSSTIFHLFMEGVLDKDEDRELIEEIKRRHILNPEEFATPYPFPSMAISDKSCEGHATFNSWGYYSQGLIALRATLWMDEYGLSRELDALCRAWLSAWTEHFDYVKLGQELDPITGVPTKSSEWYSSTMLFYLYAKKRLDRTIT